MSDVLVEKYRRDEVFRIAERTGIMRRLQYLVPSAGCITETEVKEVYDQAKRMLRRVGHNSDAYDDRKRLIACVSLLTGVIYGYLEDALDDETDVRFWDEFCPPLVDIARKSMSDPGFEAVEKVMRRVDASFNVVTDNHPILFHSSFEQPLVEATENHGLPELSYRVPGTARMGHGIYVSGEGWGNKRDPETWKNIIDDIGLEAGSIVVAVDDSPAKLAALINHKAFKGLSNVYPVLLGRNDKEVCLARTIETMEELPNLVSELMN